MVVSGRAPQLLPWVTSCCEAHSKLYCQGKATLSSEEGVQQGDPLGPLLFALAWHKVVKDSAVNMIWSSWFLDDGHLVGNIHDLALAFATICKAKETLKTEARLNKCKLGGPGIHSRQGAKEVVFPPEIPLDYLIRQVVTLPFIPRTGLRVLGGPVNYPGSFEFAKDAFRRLVGNVEGACPCWAIWGTPTSSIAYSVTASTPAGSPTSCGLLTATRSMESSSEPPLPSGIASEQLWAQACRTHSGERLDRPSNCPALG